MIGLLNWTELAHLEHLLGYHKSGLLAATKKEKTYKLRVD